MPFLEKFKAHLKSLQSSKQGMAWTIALAADALQIVAFPLFVEGGISPADSALDLIVAFVMIRLLGWHWAFLPSVAAKLIPGADLFPTWTAAVWFVTRQQVNASPDATFNVNTDSNVNANSVSNFKEVEILPPGPAPERRR
jgi:hypothetical protein